MKCPECNKVPNQFWECSRIVCPNRKVGRSLENPVFEFKHTGTGWDRFYKGQHKPPKSGAK